MAIPFVDVRKYMRFNEHESSNFRPRFYSDSRGDYWKEALSEDGVYYYNTRTRETTWDKPSNLMELGFVDSCAPASAKSVGLVGTDYGYGREDEDESSTIQDSRPIVGTDWISHTLKNGQTYYSNPKTQQTSWEAPSDVKYIRKRSTFHDTDKTLPVVAEPIFGSSWYLVMTGLGDLFYYNHSTRKSTWYKPEELQDNIAVESVIQNMEQKKKGLRMLHTVSHLTEARKSLDSDPEDVSNFLHKLEPTHSERPQDQVLQQISTRDPSINSRPINDPRDHLCEDEEVQYDTNETRYTYAERFKAFNDLLEEKKVSAFSTYESELVKLEKDPRFLQLSTKDRKSLFNQYIKDRVEEEKHRKIDEIHSKQQKFKDFLKQVVKSTRSSYTDILMKYGTDPRFKIIPKEREREHLFQEYMVELNKKVNEQSTDCEVTDVIKKEIFEMFSELPQADVQTPWRRVKRQILNDSRYLKLGEEKCQRFYDEYIEKKVEIDKLKALERSKIEREKRSIIDREKQVQAEKARSLNALDKEKHNMAKNQSVELFKNMLTELVTDSKISWSEAKRILRSDERWDECIDKLGRDEYLGLFDRHIDKLNQKDIDDYYKLLHEVGCNLNSRWDDVYPVIKDDYRCKRYSRNEKSCKNRFYSFLEASRKKAIEELKELLMETKMADGTFLSKAKLIPSLYGELYRALETDKRYTIFDNFQDERTKIIDEYLLEMQKKTFQSLPHH